MTLKKGHKLQIQTEELAAFHQKQGVLSLWLA